MWKIGLFTLCNGFFVIIDLFFCHNSVNITVEICILTEDFYYLLDLF